MRANQTLQFFKYSWRHFEPVGEVTNRRSNLCQITAYILPVIASLLSLDDLNRFSGTSNRTCSVKKGVLKNFANFTGNLRHRSEIV